MNSILTSTILLVVVFLVNSVYAQNLFPPVEATENFALQQASFATSTCGMCEDGELGCTLCNSSCPYERQVPEPMNLLEAGALASGVVRRVCTICVEHSNRGGGGGNSATEIIKLRSGNKYF